MYYQVYCIKPPAFNLKQAQAGRMGGSDKATNALCFFPKITKSKVLRLKWPVGGQSYCAVAISSPCSQRLCQLCCESGHQSELAPMANQLLMTEVLQVLGITSVLKPGKSRKYNSRWWSGRYLTEERTRAIEFSAKVLESCRYGQT
jgi:hypothetical protein